MNDSKKPTDIPNPTTVEVTSCSGCPFAHTELDRFGYADGLECTFPGSTATPYGLPPDDCPLHTEAALVVLVVQKEDHEEKNR